MVNHMQMEGVFGYCISSRCTSIVSYHWINRPLDHCEQFHGKGIVLDAFDMNSKGGQLHKCFRTLGSYGAGKQLEYEAMDWIYGLTNFLSFYFAKSDHGQTSQVKRSLYCWTSVQSKMLTNKSHVPKVCHGPWKLGRGKSLLFEYPSLDNYVINRKGSVWQPQGRILDSGLRTAF